MLLAVLLLQLVVWTLFASAFYPFKPLWLQEKEELTLLGEAKRNVAVENSEDGSIFRIEKKNAQGNDSPALLAAKQASWLKEKFRHTRSGVSIGAIEKRESSFKIMDATKPTQAMAAGISQDGTDYSYFVKAGLGSKSKQLNLLVDTGAGSSWVMGSGCADAPCSIHNTFGQDDSATFSDRGRSFSVSYGSGKVHGNLVTDTISLAGISLKYTFGQASNASAEFSHFAFDGILGLSMGQGASDNFLKTLKDAKKLDKSLFGIHLNRASDGSNHGEIKFGSTNPDRYTGDISYTSVDSTEGDWAIRMDDMAYDGKNTGAGGVLSYIDTGTSFIFGPPKLIKKIHDMIPGSSSSDGSTFTVPCDSDKSLTFKFSGVDYKVSSKDWVSPKDNSGHCTSNLYGYEVVEGALLLGDTFLKNVYAVFDPDQKRIGFAAAAGSQGGSSSGPNGGGGSSSSPTATGPTAATATTLITGATAQSDSSTQTQRPPPGLSGHETGIARSGGSPAKSTESTTAAASIVNSQQHAKLTVAILLAVLVAVIA
ncbi:Peptidase A1 [Metarhizium rileyi]|uniref:Peptidase A1 n=1 Tax=Metarhizium rileyi (strain RCEF 4871) TaxID=1649241 RepID=A0A162JH64_METRR|nr:Peptidase A1 [Metarhizium rileyi RCEF 4871]